MARGFTKRKQNVYNTSLDGNVQETIIGNVYAGQYIRQCHRQMSSGVSASPHIGSCACSRRKHGCEQKIAKSVSLSHITKNSHSYSHRSRFFPPTHVIHPNPAIPSSTILHVSVSTKRLPASTPQRPTNQITATTSPENLLVAHQSPLCTFLSCKYNSRHISSRFAASPYTTLPGQVAEWLLRKT